MKKVVILDLDHPGAKDPIYKERRNYIADQVNNFWDGEGKIEIPVIEYVLQEEKTWQTVNKILDELHPRTQYVRHSVISSNFHLNTLQLYT